MLNKIDQFDFRVALDQLRVELDLSDTGWPEQLETAFSVVKQRNTRLALVFEVFKNRTRISGMHLRLQIKTYEIKRNAHCWSIAVQFRKMIVGAIRMEGLLLENNRGERLLFEYDPNIFWVPGRPGKITGSILGKQLKNLVT